jgi:hypothetical protein
MPKYFLFYLVYRTKGCRFLNFEVYLYAGMPFF